MSFVLLSTILACTQFNIHKVHIPTEQTNEEIASDYVSNIIAFDSMFSNQNYATRFALNTYPSFLADAYEEDYHLSFENLSDEEKKNYFNQWESDYVELLLEKFNEDSDLASLIKLENDAFKMTELETFRSASTFDEDLFLSRWQLRLY